jgi:hypothetical protein
VILNECSAGRRHVNRGRNASALLRFNPSLLLGRRNHLAMVKAGFVSLPPALLFGNNRHLLCVKLACNIPSARRCKFGIIPLHLECLHDIPCALYLLLRVFYLQLVEVELGLCSSGLLLCNRCRLQRSCCLCKL